MGQFLWFTSLPAQGVHFALYLAYLLKKSNSPNSILAAISGVSWAHRKAMLEDPCTHSLVGEVRDAAKRLLSRPVQKKLPLSVVHLRKIVETFAKPGAYLNDLQTVLIMVLGLTGFLG